MREDAKKYRHVAFPQKGVSGDTGLWRSLRPVRDAAKCTGCQLCWIYCPEAVIDRETLEIDYKYCKGCGICANECPVGAIAMKEEAGE